MLRVGWVNIGTGVTAIVTLIFTLVVCGLAIGINTRILQSTTQDILISGEVLFLLGLLVFPATWVGIAASMSHRVRLYVVLVVIALLGLLAAIALLIHSLVWYNGKIDVSSAGSNVEADRIILSMIIFIGIVVLCMMILLSCGIIGLVKGCTEPRGGHTEKPPKYSTKYASDERGYPSYSAQQPLGVRTLTYGSPEWDKFYKDFYQGRGARSEVGYGYEYSSRDRDYKRSKPARNFSYRY